MSGFELFGGTRARTCVISTLDDITDHYPITVLTTGFSLIVRLAIVTLLLTDRDVSTAYCWLSSNGVDRDLLCGTVSKRSAVGACDRCIWTHLWFIGWISMLDVSIS